MSGYEVGEWGLFANRYGDDEDEDINDNSPSFFFNYIDSYSSSNQKISEITKKW